MQRLTNPHKECRIAGGSKLVSLKRRKDEEQRLRSRETKNARKENVVKSLRRKHANAKETKGVIYECLLDRGQAKGYKYKYATRE